MRVAPNVVGARSILFLVGKSDRPETALIAGVAASGVKARVLGELSQSSKDMLFAAGASVEDMPCPSRFSLSYVRSLAPIIRETSPDLIHAFTSRTLSNALIVNLLEGTPPIIGYRGTMGHITKLDPAAWASYLHPQLSGVMCVSDAVKRSLASAGVHPSKLCTVYKGHDPTWYGGVTAASRRDLGIPENAFLICCVANMRPVKGVDVLLEAAKILPANGAIHYLLVGEVRDKRVSELAESPELKNIVTLTGPRTDALSLVAASDLLVVPSRSREGLPKALLEAMSLGVPVVASAVGGIPEVIRPGIDGVLVPPKDPHSLARGILELWENRPQLALLAQSGQDRVRSVFHLQASVTSLMKLYETLLRDGRFD